MKNAVIDRATTGDGTAVITNSDSSKRIFIYGIMVIVDDDVATTLEYGASSVYTALTGPLPLKAGGGFQKPTSSVPYYILPPGKSFHVKLAGAIQASGDVQYVIK